MIFYGFLIDTFHYLTRRCLLRDHHVGFRLRGEFLLLVMFGVIRFVVTEEAPSPISRATNYPNFLCSAITPRSSITTVAEHRSWSLSASLTFG